MKAVVVQRNSFETNGVINIVSLNVQNSRSELKPFLLLDVLMARYMYSVAVCLPLVCPSQVGVLSKWLNLSSHKQRMMTQGL